MLKWFALLLVTTVLCWGDSNHSNSKNEIISRPVEDSRSIETKQNEAEDSLLDKKELTNLIEDLESVTPPIKIGEQDSDQTTTPHL
ncbi:MAG: hypothetical protein NT000_09915 [Proteobacteria bacterium]|nr:hypothetical protein [Pseudomonadota bacterium]